MNSTFKFQKILTLKQNEKEQALSLYQESVKKFTEALEHLYELLKKKEDLEEQQLQELAQGLPVHKIRHYQLFINNLEKSIAHAQTIVNHARRQMNWYQDQLKKCNVEVKKYEKLKEKHEQLYKEFLRKTENMLLDEFSSQQYFHRGGS